MEEQIEIEVLYKILETKKEEAIIWWRELHNKKLSNSYSLYNINVMKLRRIKWVGNVVWVGKIN
jgi:hypothetical protein